MALLEYMLEQFDQPNEFENLCCQVLHQSGYLDINPIGGKDDKGRDAVENLYESQQGKRKVVFQFSLEKNVKSKVERTLIRLQESEIKPHQLIFVFRTKISPTLRDSLVDFALKNYQIDLDLKDQRYLLVRLELDTYKDIFHRYFSHEIDKINELSRKGLIFISDATVTEQQKRCLINLMFYSRHAIAGDIKTQIIKENISRVFADNGNDIDHATLISKALSCLPTTISNAEIKDVVDVLCKSGVLFKNKSGRYEILADVLEDSKKAVAELYTAQQAFHKYAFDLCKKSLDFSLIYVDTIRIIDDVLCELFRLYGHEVAHAILNFDSISSDANALDEEQINKIITKATAAAGAMSAKVIREVFKKILLDPPAESLPYLSALSTSYICSLLLNSNPDAIQFQIDRVKNSVAVFDTDVLLTGIVSGAKRNSITKELIATCRKMDIEYFAFKESIEEIVFRIKRSIQAYHDLGCPSFIPPDKADLVQDIFLDIYFKQLSEGVTTSFEKFIERYYDTTSPQVHIESLLYEELNVECRSSDQYYIEVQEDKIKRIQEIIEKSRKQTMSFKNSNLYHKDAKAMVIIEQQNRQNVKMNSLGRWYLISGDKHILNAYLQKRKSFKIKPCVLARHFIELLRQIPENAPSSSSFGAILKSEALMKGPGKNYIAIIASMTKLGVKALEYSRDQLLEIIDEMERADFTSWLIKLRSYGNLPTEMKEELCSGLEKLFAESASRTQVMQNLKQISLPQV